jgi:hypothetical protein
VRLDHEATPVRVNQRMTFAPVDLLAGLRARPARDPLSPAHG